MKSKLIIYALVLFVSFCISTEDSYALDDQVQVSIPRFEVHINGEKIDNEKNEFPLLVYKDMIYIPMTWDYCNALGLSISWDSKAGLEIEKSYNYHGLKQTLTSNNEVSKSYYASIVTFPVTVNGNAIDNSKEEYPLLLHKDITYFPLTSRFAVDEFDWNIDWSDETGFKIDVKKQEEISVTKSPLKIKIDDNLINFKDSALQTGRHILLPLEEIFKELGYSVSVKHNIIILAEKNGIKHTIVPVPIEELGEEGLSDRASIYNGTYYISLHRLMVITACMTRTDDEYIEINTEFLSLKEALMRLANSNSYSFTFDFNLESEISGKRYALDAYCEGTIERDENYKSEEGNNTSFAKYNVKTNENGEIQTITATTLRENRDVYFISESDDETIVKKYEMNSQPAREEVIEQEANGLLIDTKIEELAGIGLAQTYLMQSISNDSVEKEYKSGKKKYTFSFVEDGSEIIYQITQDKDGNITDIEINISDDSNGTIISTAKITYNHNKNIDSIINEMEDFKTHFYSMQYENVDVSKAIEFPDKALENAIRKEINKETGDIRQEDLLEITSLEIRSNKGEEKIESIEGLQYCINLKDIYLYKQNISDISPLEKLTKLESLTIFGSSIEKIDALKNLKELKVLNLTYNEVVDITPIKNLNKLERVSFYDNDIEEIDVLKNLKELKVLNLSKNEIVDLTPIENLNKLERLDLYRNSIKKIDALRNLKSLKELDISSNRIKEISSLIYLAQLENLDMSFNEKVDITPVGSLTQLKILDISNSNISDISSIKHLTQLEKLNISINDITDISTIKNLTQLLDLDISRNNIYDISPLEDLTQLQFLSLGVNQIVDISSLKKLTNLERLWLFSNKIKDITPLKNMKNLVLLSIQNNEIEDISPIIDLKSITDLKIDGNDIKNIELLNK